MITLLGLASFVFVVGFTLRSYHAGDNPRAAIIEAWVNITIGFAINYAANLLLLPQLGAQFTHAENFLLGWIYTSISIIRQYAVRRWFQERINRLANTLAKA